LCGPTKRTKFTGTYVGSTFSGFVVWKQLTRKDGVQEERRTWDGSLEEWPWEDGDKWRSLSV